MPRSPAPPWSARHPLIVSDATYHAEEVDEWVRESVRRADGNHDPKTGWYAPIYIDGVKDRDEAKEIERAIRRCANYLFKKGRLYVGSHVEAKKNPDGSYRVMYVAVHKDFTYAYMIKRYGEDRTKWPYSTNRYHPNYNS